MTTTLGTRNVSGAGPLNLNLTPDQSSSRVVELSQKIIAQNSATPAELTVLLFYATGASQGGQVPAEVQQSLRDVLVKVPHAAEAIRKIRTEFMVPSMSDQSAAELQQAFTQLTGQASGFDALGVKKLLALAASQNRLSSDEVRGLSDIASQPQVSEESKATIRSAVMEALVSQLERMATDPAKASVVFKDIFSSASTDGRFFGAAEEAYFGSTFDGSTSSEFRQLAASMPDATRLELELAHRLSGQGGKLDNAKTQKLFDRIEANAQVGTHEAEFASGIDKDPDGRGVLATKIGRLSYVDANEKQWLTELSQKATPAELPSLDKGLSVTSAIMTKTGTASLNAAGTATLNASLQDLMARRSNLDALALSLWRSVRGGSSDQSVALDALQMGMPVPTGQPNDYPPQGQDELSAVKQIGDFQLTPLTYGTSRYLQFSTLGSTNGFIQLEAGGALSLCEHRGDAVILSGSKVQNASIAMPGQVTELPSLPTTSQTFRIAEHNGSLLAVSGEVTGGPSMYRFDDAQQKWAPVDARVPAGPLKVVTSLNELGTLMVSQAGETAMFNQAGTTVALPALPRQFSVESATSLDGQIVVTGANTSTSGAVTRELYSLDPANLAAGWSRVGQDLPWVVLDRKQVLVAQSPAKLVEPLRLSGEGLLPKRVPYTAAELERLTRLANETIDQLAAAGPLSAADASTALEVLETLHENKVLKADLAKKGDALFGAVTDDAALKLVAERWYQAGLTTLTEADVTAAKEALLAQTPISHQALSRFMAQSRASKMQLEHLLAIEPSHLAAGDTDLAAAELARALGRRVDTLVGGRVKDADATSVLEAAKKLKTAYPVVASTADVQVKRLLTLGRMSGTTPDVFRSYLADVTPPTDAEVRLALAWFSKNGGGITTAELRALTALTDSDGVRSEVEQRAIESLDWRALAPNAAINAPRVIKGVTTAADIMGDEKPVSGSTKVDGTGPLVVWARENNAASEQQTVSVDVSQPIETSATGLSSGPIRVTGATVLASVNGLQPFPNGGTVTDDGFDQVQVVWGSDNLLKRLQGVGVDINSFLQNSRNSGLVSMKVNAMPDQNAYYSSSANEMVFGTSNNTWHLASDTDVVTHELGHFTLDHLNPNMLGSQEGGAIHEGYGDMLAALIFNDPEVSEDFNPGRSPTWLRNVENEDKLSTVSTEVHDRGQVYGGFTWSMKKKLSSLIGDDAEAANLMLGVTVAHGLFYPSSAVTPELFMTAMLKAAETYLANKVSPAVLQELQSAMKDEGIKRELIPTGWSPPAQANAPQLMAALRAPRVGPSAAGPLLTGTELARRMTAFTKRDEVEYRIVSEPRIGNLRKAILQAHATGPDQKTYPVEDGFVTVALNRDSIETVGGRGRQLPTFDFTKPSFTEDQARISARDLALKGLTSGDPRTNGYVLQNIDDIFAPEHVTYQEVLSAGQRAIKVITRAAEFSVRRDGTIEVSKVMHVD